MVETCIRRGGCSGCSNKSGAGRECGRNGCCGSCGRRNREIILTESEKEFLMLLAQIPFLPVVRFVGKSTKTARPGEAALAPVYLSSKDDPVSAVLENSLTLQALAAKRLITIDDDKPLQNYDYSVYEASEAYKDFLLKNENPQIECGSIALTSLGQEVLDSLDIFF